MINGKLFKNLSKKRCISWKNFLLIIILLIALGLLVWFLLSIIDYGRYETDIKKIYEKNIDNMLIDYRILALVNGDVNYCNKISNTESKNACYDFFYTVNGAENKDLTLCNKAIDMNTKNLCSAVLNNHETECTGITREYLCKALINNDVAICSHIKELENQTRCKYEFFYINAVKTNDISLCNNIDSLETLTECKAVMKHDPTIYTSFMMKIAYYNACLQVAVSNRDKRICKKIRNDEIKEKCIREVDDEVQISLAISEKNITKCNQLQKKDRKSACLGIINLDATECRKIGEIGIKYNCFKEIAFLTANRSLCEELGTESLIAQCYNYSKFDYNL